jgi:ParB-like nuclease domain
MRKTNLMSKANDLSLSSGPSRRSFPYARNARKIPQSAIDKVAGSIQEFGWRQPIVVDSGGVIVAGHTRLLAAQKLGLKTVPVHVASDLSPTQIKAYRLADNRLADESSFDDGLLALEIADLRALNFDVQLTGFNADELMAISAMRNATSEGLTEDDAVPPTPSFPVTELGDLWTLGNHRILCGDSTNIEHVQILMRGENARMLFTDIPYNVAFNGRSGDFEVIKNDKLAENEFANFLNGFAGVLTTLDIPETYQCCDWRLYPRLFDLFGCKAVIVWAKNLFGMRRGYRHQHELIVYNGNFDSTTESDLWQILDIAR